MSTLPAHSTFKSVAKIDYISHLIFSFRTVKLGSAKKLFSKRKEYTAFF